MNIRHIDEIVTIRFGAVVFGALQGLLIYLINQPDMHGLSKFAEESLETFFWVAPASFILVVAADRLRHAAVYALALGILLSLVEVFARSRFGLAGNTGGDLIFALVVSGLWISFAGATYFSAWCDSGRFPPPYASLFLHAWNNLATMAVAGAFVGGGWLILLLWGALFNVIEIDFFKTVFREGWFAVPFSFAALAFGIAFSREMKKVIFAARALVLGLCAILAIALAAIGTSFVLALPFTGLQPLWNTGSAAMILMTVVILVALGAIALVREGGDDVRIGKTVNYVMMAGLLSSSALILIAFYALYLRVDQRGLTPDRVYAITGLLGAAVFALPLGWSVARNRVDWPKGLVKSKSLIGMGTIILALFVHLPPFEPYGLSARNQIQRLKVGTVPPQDFDFGYLHFQLGEPGRAALEELRADENLPDREVILSELSRLNSFENYYSWKAAKKVTEISDRLRNDSEAVDRLLELEEYLAIYPADSWVPDEIRDFLIDVKLDWLFQCSRQTGNRKCILLLIDFDFDGHIDILHSEYGPQGFVVLLYEPKKQQWLFDSRIKAYRSLVWRNVFAAIESGDVRLAPVQRYDLEIGDATYR